MTIGALYQELKGAAVEIYGALEGQQVARILLEEIWGIDKMQLMTNREGEVDTTCHPELDSGSLMRQQLEKVVADLKLARPIQYIIGEADFCDLRLKVREGCLIPRPESEELVRWIAQSNLEPRRILDVGTGSGALAIALQRHYPDAEVTALDVSDDALEIAAQNVAELAPRVKLVEGDALAGVERFVEGEFDLVVSNPPYIPQSEIAQMRANVVEHEPHLALFVADHDPLLFYRKIAQSGMVLLRIGGAIFYEVHENFAQQTAEMLEGLGYMDVEVRRDINDKARMVCGTRR
ncbi:MAG: peptide chain release factor N(5)-glutamine methyltransferase [Rikenellaceae bacterium]